MRAWVSTEESSPPEKPMKRLRLERSAALKAEAGAEAEAEPVPVRASITE
jgi:hypothetical protein